jgi:hypothetical protein
MGQVVIATSLWLIVHTTNQTVINLGSSIYQAETSFDDAAEQRGGEAEMRSQPSALRDS